MSALIRHPREGGVLACSASMPIAPQRHRVPAFAATTVKDAIA